MENAVLRVPALEETGIRKFYNGPESFTPDNQFILGEAPEVRSFFVGAGFNSVGIASAGGAGRALAEWIVEGEPTMRPHQRRRPPLRTRSTATTSGCTTGSREVLGLHYEIPWPNREMRTARPFRRSPLYAHLVAGERELRQPDGLGARQLLRARRATEPVIEYSWGKQNWLPWSAAEHAEHPRERDRLRPDLVLEVPPRRTATPRRPSSGCAPPTSRCPWAAPSTPGCSTSAAPTSPT